VVSEYEAQHPDIKVKLEYWPGQNFYDKLRVLYAAGQMSDVADMELKQMPDFVYRKMVTDITDLASQAGVKQSDYWPRQWAKVQFQGKMWAFPLDSQDAVIFYNKAVFDQAGIPYPPKNWDDPTWTWDNVLQICQKITKGTGANKVWGIDVSTWWVYAYPFVWSWGGTVLNDQHTNSTLTMPETMAAFQYRADLINKYKVHPAAADVTQGVDHLFGANRLAMKVDLNTTAYVYKDVPNLKFDMAPMPASKAGAWTRAPSDVIALGSQTKVREQAFSFAHYLTGPDGLKLMDIQAGLGIPPLTSLANDFTHPTVAGVENLNWSMVLDIEAKVKAKYQDVTIQWPQMDNMLTAEYQIVLNGKETASQMATKLSPQIDALLQQIPPEAHGWIGD
jgi:multiple sugar transport system substrate-binding protein